MSDEICLQQAMHDHTIDLFAFSVSELFEGFFINLIILLQSSIESIASFTEYNVFWPYTMLYNTIIIISYVYCRFFLTCCVRIYVISHIWSLRFCDVCMIAVLISISLECNIFGTISKQNDSLIVTIILLVN